ncbi:MAG: haloacid dehalogenase-like hydrolase [bacterium]|nr:haloacid dehalogenase-like hydrolase [bacterium]
MKFLKGFIFLVLLLFSTSIFANQLSTEKAKSSVPTYTYKYINGFSAVINHRIEKFLNHSKQLTRSKVAVFDCDGTLIGQVPNYVADEATYLYASKHPNWHPQVIKKLEAYKTENNSYDFELALYYAGMKSSKAEDIGYNFYKKYYKNKYFPKMLQLVKNFQNYNFQIWVVTSSPEILYEKIVSEQFNIPINHVIGVRTLIKNGVLSKTIIPPITEDAGKVDAINTFIKTRPLFVAGNSRGDFEMIKYSKGIKMIVNPNNIEKKKVFNGMTLKGYALKHDWIIAHCKDVAPKGYTFVSHNVYHIPENTVHI